MALNTYKIPGRISSNSGRTSHSGGGFFALLDKFLRIDESLSQVIHVKFLPQILFVSLVCILYIGNRHYAEKQVRAINKLENEVEDLRADYITLKADYKFASKQSEVAKKARSLGLVESEHPPFKVIIQEE